MSSVAVFGLGAVGLAVVQGAKAVGAQHIVGIDVNPKKYELATKLGCTSCINPLDHKDTPMQQVLVSTSPGECLDAARGSTSEGRDEGII